MYTTIGVNVYQVRSKMGLIADHTLPDPVYGYCYMINNQYGTRPGDYCTL